MNLSKDGFRVHLIARGPVEMQREILGNVHTALCGHVWKPTITDHSELEKLPICYGCVEKRMDEALEDYLLFQNALNEYNREN